MSRENDDPGEGRSAHRPHSLSPGRPTESSFSQLGGGFPNFHRVERPRLLDPGLVSPVGHPCKPFPQRRLGWLAEHTAELVVVAVGGGHLVPRREVLDGVSRSAHRRGDLRGEGIDRVAPVGPDVEHLAARAVDPRSPGDPGAMSPT